MSADGTTGGGPRTMKASEFKARCLKLMDEVSEDGGEIIITKRGKPVAKLSPCEAQPGPWFGRNRDSIRILGDIVSPMPEEWYAEPGAEKLT